MVKYYTSDNGEQSDPKPDEVESPWEQFAQEQYKALLEEGDDEDSSVLGVGNTFQLEKENSLFTENCRFPELINSDPEISRI